MGRNSEFTDDWRHQDPDDVDAFERMRSTKDHSLPASSKRQSKNAARKTDGSRKASRKIAQAMGGINRRRTKRIT